MDQAVRTMETTGRLVDAHHIETAVDLPVGQAVRVVVDDAELGEDTWRRLAAQSPAYAFLNDPAEDLYTLEDGQPLELTES
jgi:hypothetical protein